MTVVEAVKRITRFDTYAEASAYGWVHPRWAYRRDRQTPGFRPERFLDGYLTPPGREEDFWDRAAFVDLGHELIVIDSSGPNAQGYSYAIVLRSQYYHAPAYPYLLRSTTVWLSQEPNQLRQPGCFCQRFHRDDLLLLVEEHPYRSPVRQEKTTDE